MTFLGMLRVKNEARWIRRVLAALNPVCQHLYVMDDHSTDGTDRLCEENQNTTLIRSPFQGLDETRDKNFLLKQIMGKLPPDQIGPDSKTWILAVDGDEELEPEGAEKIKRNLDPSALVYVMRILFLWNDPQHVRTDGVYANFTRPSLFRLISKDLEYGTTSAGGNFHCTSIPTFFVRKSRFLDVKLYHYGYMQKEDRIRKYLWYNEKDPNNDVEDRYRHMIQGDVPEVPAHWRRHKELKHAGPLTLQKVNLPGMEKGVLL